MSENNFEKTSEPITRSVLVTGANGFVGTNLCKRLISDGYHVIAGIRKSANLDLLEDLDIEYRY
ncbi:MAG: NAD-dependent epimerase/dehydratase family protein, partial [candidate division Zixibacteria bacterium]|nr:NAD-dependent epimerase/dehydratase family protein [candidate division Zixibacteria bacterium]